MKKVEDKKWFEDWSVITCHTNHGDIVKVVSVPNAKAGRKLFTFEVWDGDPTQDLITLLECALYELTAPKERK